MKVSKTIKSKHGSKIQIADNRYDGNSSWGEKGGHDEPSIRLAWFNENGRFDPISSAEVPIWGIIEMLKKASENDLFSKEESAEMIGFLTSAIYRNL